MKKIFFASAFFVALSTRAMACYVYSPPVVITQYTAPSVDAGFYDRYYQYTYAPYRQPEVECYGC